MNIEKIVTIGAYGFTEERFFQALQEIKIDCFCDVRRRRGVRGAEYAFANSVRLQKRLAEWGIFYWYVPAFAPPVELRTQQQAQDKAQKVKKRQRDQLSPQFVEAYHLQVLQPFNLAAWMKEVPAHTRTLAFFCVEKQPQACHRSLLAHHIAHQLHLPVHHILP